MVTFYVTYRPTIGTVITNPHTGTKYVLQKVIGISFYDFIYKACYYTVDSSVNGSLLPSGYVTIKFLRPGPEIVRTRVQERLENPNPNLIYVESWFIRNLGDGFAVALPYMSEGSLRYILSTRFHYGLPEDCVAIALKEGLKGLQDIHNSGRVHKYFSAGDIFVNYKKRPVSSVEIKLAYAGTVYESDLEAGIDVNQGINTDDLGLCRGESSVPPLMIMSEWAAAPEVYYTKYNDYDSDDDNRNPASIRDVDESYYTAKADIWLVGLAALELAYGNIRVTHRSEFEAMIKKIRRLKKLPSKLEFVLEEVYEEDVGGKMKKVVGYFKDKMKSVKKKRVFSKDFEELVVDCLSNKPEKRPTVEELLQRPFFQNTKDLKWFQRRVLQAKNPIPVAD